LAKKQLAFETDTAPRLLIKLCINLARATSMTNKDIYKLQQ